MQRQQQQRASCSQITARQKGYLNFKPSCMTRKAFDLLELAGTCALRARLPGCKLTEVSAHSQPVCLTFTKAAGMLQNLSDSRGRACLVKATHLEQQHGVKVLRLEAPPAQALASLTPGAGSCPSKVRSCSVPTVQTHSAQCGDGPLKTRELMQQTKSRSSICQQATAQDREQPVTAYSSWDQSSPLALALGDFGLLEPAWRCLQMHGAREGALWRKEQEALTAWLSGQQSSPLALALGDYGLLNPAQQDFWCTGHEKERHAALQLGRPQGTQQLLPVSKIFADNQGSPLALALGDFGLLEPA